MSLELATVKELIDELSSRVPALVLAYPVPDAGSNAEDHGSTMIFKNGPIDRKIGLMLILGREGRRLMDVECDPRADEDEV